MWHIIWIEILFWFKKKNIKNHPTGSFEVIWSQKWAKNHFLFRNEWFVNKLNASLTSMNPRFSIGGFVWRQTAIWNCRPIFGTLTEFNPPTAHNLPPAHFEKFQIEEKLKRKRRKTQKEKSDEIKYEGSISEGKDDKFKISRFQYFNMKMDRTLELDRNLEMDRILKITSYLGFFAKSVRFKKKGCLNPRIAESVCIFGLDYRDPWTAKLVRIF